MRRRSRNCRQLSQLKLPSVVPLSGPSLLVEQGPDIRAAEANLHAATAAVGVARANRLPNITLSANLGASALHAGQLFAPGTGSYTLAANAAQPIFDGMTLLNKERAAVAALEQADAQYRATVISTPFRTSQIRCARCKQTRERSRRLERPRTRRGAAKPRCRTHAAQIWPGLARRRAQLAARVPQRVPLPRAGGSDPPFRHSRAMHGAWRRLVELDQAQIGAPLREQPAARNCTHARPGLYRQRKTLFERCSHRSRNVFCVQGVY